MNEKAVIILAISLSIVSLALLVRATTLNSLAIQKAQTQIIRPCVTVGRTETCSSGGNKSLSTSPSSTPSNCNGVEDENDLATERTEQQFGDNDTIQPPGVVCPPEEDEPYDQEGTPDE